MKCSKAFTTGDMAESDFFDMLFYSVPSDLISEALASNDLMLAVALHSRFENFYSSIARTVLRKSPELRASAVAEITETRKKLVDEYATMTKTLPSRFEDFKNACPKIRGVWSGAIPQDYKTLVAYWHSAFVSYSKAWNLSSTVYFETWGGAMLDVMLFINGSPESADMEKAFDEALAKYIKTHKNTGDASDD